MKFTFGIIYSIATGIIIIFQGCLAAGLPWGSASMGGKFPGKYPPKMRFVAVVNMLILALLALIVLTRANVLFSALSTISIYIIWLVVAFSGISVILNTISKSKIEKIWVPISIIQLISSLIVAI